MAKPALVILAAGMASRYGSMKQVEGFGPSGETIMEYSIYDAIRSGFGKVVFIIRRAFYEQFRDSFASRLEGRIETDYVFQELDAYTEGFPVPAVRSKPWGTAHAVLCAREAVNGPFAVINADDFYGYDAFLRAASFLTDACRPDRHAIVGYDLMRTLSDHGTVNRGVCRLDPAGRLSGVTERINISKRGDRIVCDDGLEPEELPIDTRVSMNFWCFDPSWFQQAAGLFREFLQQRGEEPKSEFFIPLVADRFIRDGGRIEVLPTTAEWFGVTYREDAPFVQHSLDRLIAAGVYPGSLWA